MWINKIIYIALTIYAAILALIYSEVQALYAFCILVLLPLVFLGHVLLARRRLQVSLTAKVSLAVVGMDSIPLCLHVTNGSILPISCIRIKLEYENTYLDHRDRQVLMISVGARNDKHIDFVLQSTHTGLVKVKVTKVKVYDFLRILSRSCKCEATVEVPVLPEIYGIDSDIFIREPEFVESDQFSKNKPGDDPSEVFDIREYKEGDKIHRIHWKLSSKKDTVMVKDYSLPIINSSTIIINTGLPSGVSDPLSYMDAVLATTAAVSYHLLINDYRHYVGWYDQKKGRYASTTLEDFDGLHYMMSDLIQVTPTAEKNSILEAYQVYGEGKQVSKLFYITYELEEDTIELLMDSFGQAEIEILLVREEGHNEEDANLGKRFHKQYISISDTRTSIEALLL